MGTAQHRDRGDDARAAGRGWANHSLEFSDTDGCLEAGPSIGSSAPLLSKGTTSKGQMLQFCLGNLVICADVHFILYNCPIISHSGQEVLLAPRALGLPGD